MSNGAFEEYAKQNKPEGFDISVNGASRRIAEHAWQAACEHTKQSLSKEIERAMPSEDEVMETDKVDWDDPLGVYHYIREEMRKRLEK
jgi:hypothetical protein